MYDQTETNEIINVGRDVKLLPSVVNVLKQGFLLKRFDTNAVAATPRYESAVPVFITPREIG